MKKIKPIVTRNAAELAKALGLTPADAKAFNGVLSHRNGSFMIHAPILAP